MRIGYLLLATRLSYRKEGVIWVEGEQWSRAPGLVIAVMDPVDSDDMR